MLCSTHSSPHSIPFHSIHDSRNLKVNYVHGKRPVLRFFDSDGQQMGDEVPLSHLSRTDIHDRVVARGIEKDE